MIVHAISLLALLVVASGCVTTMIEGAQLDEPPPGLAFDPNCEAARLVLRDRPKLRQRCYVGHGESPDWITITEFQGVATRSDFEAAKTYFDERYRDTLRGPIEELNLDGRPAWGYPTRYVYNGQTSSMGYVAVVPYETSTYSIEFDARSIGSMDPTSIRRTVGSFVVRSKKDADPSKTLLGIALAAGILFAVRHVSRMKKETKPPIRPTPRPRPAVPVAAAPGAPGVTARARARPAAAAGAAIDGAPFPEEGASLPPAADAPVPPPVVPPRPPRRGGGRSGRE